MRKLIFVLFLFMLGCGTSDMPNHIPSLQNKPTILNGVKGTHAQFPSIIVVAKDNGETEWCTASMIAPDAFLIAAHCAGNFNSLEAFYGIDDLSPESIDSCDSCNLKLKNFKVHPAYSQSKEPWNDIAVILLEKEIEGAVLARFPPPGLIMVGDTLTAAGYGLNNDNTSGMLMYGDGPLYAFHNLFELVFGDIDDPDAVHACYGDSGGPVYFEYDGVVYMVGVTSRAPPWAYGCGHGTIYTMSEMYSGWISETYIELKSISDSGPDAGTEPEQDAGPEPDPLPESEIKEDHVILGPRGCIIGSSNDRNLSIIVLMLMCGLAALVRKRA